MSPETTGSGRCFLCPRKCGADRRAGQYGACGAGASMRVARAALHRWEEPPISGLRGSGAIFFSHCSLHCVYCQNAVISHEGVGETISEERLAKIMLDLEGQGAANINLVSATHYAAQVARSLREARAAGLSIPIVWNTSGFETKQSINTVADLVDVFLPDFKYWYTDIAERYSGAPQYRDVAQAAIRQMKQLQPDAAFDSEGLMTRGVIVRHLVLPGQTKNAKMILRYLREEYGPDVYVSLMRQYTPTFRAAEYPELNRTVNDAEYESVTAFAERAGLVNVFLQEAGAASTMYVPAFSSCLRDGR